MVAPKVVNTGTPFTNMIPSRHRSIEIDNAPTMNKTAQTLFRYCSWLSLRILQEPNHRIALDHMLLPSAIGSSRE